MIITSHRSSATTTKLHATELKEVNKNKYHAPPVHKLGLLACLLQVLAPSLQTQNKFKHESSRTDHERSLLLRWLLRLFGCTFLTIGSSSAVKWLCWLVVKSAESSPRRSVLRPQTVHLHQTDRLDLFAFVHRGSESASAGVCYCCYVLLLAGRLCRTT